MKKNVRQRLQYIALGVLGAGGSLASMAMLPNPYNIVSIGVVAAIVTLVCILLSRRPRSQFAYTEGLPDMPFAVRRANEHDVKWAALIAKTVYRGADVIPESLKLEWFAANPTGFFAIFDRHDRICGNLDILPLKPDALARLLGGKTTEHGLRGSDLFKITESSKITDLYIESLVAVSSVTEKPGNPFAVYACVAKAPQLVRCICNNGKLKRLYAISASDEGRALLKDLGFAQIADGAARPDGHDVYSVEWHVLQRRANALQEAFASSHGGDGLRKKGRSPRPCQ